MLVYVEIASAILFVDLLFLVWCLIDAGQEVDCDAYQLLSIPDQHLELVALPTPDYPAATEAATRPQRVRRLRVRGQARLMNISRTYLQRMHEIVRR